MWASGVAGNCIRRVTEILPPPHLFLEIEMRFTFRGRELYLRPSSHSHIWVMGGLELMIAKFIRTDSDTLIQLLDGCRKVVGYLSTSALCEVSFVGGVPMIGEAVDAA